MKEFPSPFGVICSLILERMQPMEIRDLLFPSPFGVICSLIYLTVEKLINDYGFRLLSELYVL